MRPCAISGCENTRMHVLEFACSAWLIYFFTSFMSVTVLSLIDRSHAPFMVLRHRGMRAASDFWSMCCKSMRPLDVINFIPAVGDSKWVRRLSGPRSSSISVPW